ncbi:SRPBCC family protein [Gilvibacter sp.]|uniref:SRPBCC family protein n=1 Tax=Gilvibacter sp. TaxID=2729997 RepID=UPI0025BD19FF|nr:SRPBCC family protein [Gilvibacter sp.]NQX78927.1 SRPBCC family protein [Gilvibacter sp.]
MKYTCEITIDSPIEEVIAKLDSAENMKHWQRGLISYEQLSGEPGQEGAQMRLNYQMGKREMSLTETIVKRNFPHEFEANYDTIGVHNIQKLRFDSTPDGKTKWVSDCEFQFQGLGMKFMGWLMPGAFKKQSLKYMTDFKAFVEDGTSVAEEA